MNLLGSSTFACFFCDFIPSTLLAVNLPTENRRSSPLILQSSTCPALTRLAAARSNGGRVHGCVGSGKAWHRAAMGEFTCCRLFACHVHSILYQGFQPLLPLQVSSSSSRRSIPFFLCTGADMPSRDYALQRPAKSAEVHVGSRCVIFDF